MTDIAARDSLEMGHAAPVGPGRLVLVVGPSGAGKDTLMNALRADLSADPRFVFARRLITRAADGATEDHDVIDRTEYDRRCACGEVALAWEAHGLGYILPPSVDAAVRQGLTVIANGARRALPLAQAKYAHVRVLLITAPRAILAERLAARGRETREQIEARLDQADLDMPGVEGLIRIDNTGSIADSVALMRAAISARD
ncbi:phosphonate metabolism protein/1,5-bisphosphokinase (PRPP-forming) PhnN [Pannonibacter sp.]|uniref:phosphonate metabolism protein/1,5-bisphosphokinase (PRPP-forming) PhnN n=1 Tax=Pannonibacter sp. TaxID=1906786 RepID=UPI003F70A6ED